AVQQFGDVLLRSWLFELPIAGARAAGAAALREARAVGAKFARLEGPVAVDALTRNDRSDLELEELPIVVHAVCLPYDAGSLASADDVSVALRSALGEELPADAGCAEVSPAFLARLPESCAVDEVIQFFDLAGGSAQPDLLELADLAPQPDDWNVGATRGDSGRIGFQLSVDGQTDRERCLTADEHDGEGMVDYEVNAAREAAAQEWA
ncbi:unnamed protein product, partial [Prorocentrum cordatum]